VCCSPTITPKLPMALCFYRFPACLSWQQNSRLVFSADSERNGFLVCFHRRPRRVGME
jgi:hypothetical protein